MRPTFRLNLFCAFFLTFWGYQGLSSEHLLGQEDSGRFVDVWIGTGGDNGLYYLTLDCQQGKLSQPTKVAEMGQAGFLALHPNEEVLYSTARVGKQGGVAAFKISAGPRKTKTLEPLGFSDSKDGPPAHVSVDQTGNVLFSAQYGGGSISSYLLDEDGGLKGLVATIEHGAGSGVVPKRQAGPHPHWVGVSPDNRFVMVPDLGRDSIVVYQLDAKTGALKPHSEVPAPPGSGPRHMTFHPQLPFAYLLNEFSMNVSVFTYDSDEAKFTPIQLIDSLPEEMRDQHLNSCSEVRFHPNGKFMYTGNRGHDSIAVFQVDQEAGQLTFVEREHIRGTIPRNFELDPSGRWLVVGGQNSNTVSLFSVDQETGALVFHRQSVNVPKPICFLIRE